MAVAFSSATQYTQAATNQLSFAVSNAGNAFCLIVKVDWTGAGSNLLTAVTCNGSTLTSNFINVNTDSYAITWRGYSKSNSSGTNNIVITTSDVADSITASVVCLSGAGSLTASNSVANLLPCDNATHIYPLSVTSQSNDLIISFSQINGDYSGVTAMSGTSASTPFWYSRTAGSSPSVSFNSTYYGDSTDVTAGYFLAGFSFAQSNGANPANPPDQVTNTAAAIPIRICGGSGYTPPAIPSNPPDQVTNDSAAIPVYFVSKPT